MMPSLTDQQRQALHEANDAGPVTILDPVTDSQYVLVRADVFHELQERMRDMEPQEAYPFVDRMMADDDADDPTLAGYQDDALAGKPA